MATAAYPATNAIQTAALSDEDRHGWGLALLLAVVAALFVRPADLVPAWEAWPIYQSLIIACLVVAYRPTLRQLTQFRIKRQPATASVLMLLVAVAVSHLAEGFVWAARVNTFEVGKLVALYLLIVGVVNTPARLFLFVRALALVITTVATLALIDRLDWLAIGAISSIRDRVAAEGWEAGSVDRIRGTGIFNDPNDFGMILVTGLILCGSSFMRPHAGLRRFVWLLPTFILMAALALTHSRGAFLSLASVVPLAIAYRRGWIYAMGSLMVLPGLAMAFSARMTDVEAITSGTGQTRIQIWSDNLMLWRENPVFGIGKGALVDELGVVSHNSFLHCFVELGWIGGTAFIGSFIAVLLGLWSQRNRYWVDEGNEHTAQWHRLAHLRMFLFVAVSAYAMGILTISRQFVPPTYLILGLGAASHFVRDDAEPAWTFDSRFMAVCFAGSVLLLLFCHVVVRLFGQF